MLILKQDHDIGAIPQGQTKDSITLAAHMNTCSS